MNQHVTRRRFLAGSLGAATATVLAPRGWTAPASAAEALARLQGEEVAIEYWHRSSGNAAEAWQTLAAAFNTEMAGRIKVTAIAQGDIQELNQKVRAAATGGGLPGAVMGDDYDITQYAANEIILPLDQYIDDPENGLTAEQKADFLPSQLMRHKLPIYGDQTMAFPQGFSCFTRFWNVDALQKAGFDAPVQTWQEFPDHVRAIAAANPGMAGWHIGGAGDRFISCLLTYGVQWLADDGQSSNFDRPEALEIMTWWKQLYDENLLDVLSGDEPQASFIGGKSAYFMDSSGNTADFNEAITTFAWDAGLPPQGANNPTPVTETYGPINAIPRTDDQQQLAGWLWLKWLTTPQALKLWIPVTNYFPSVRSVAGSPELQSYYATNPAAAKLVKDVAPLARILSPSPALTQVRGQITANVVNEVLFGRLSQEDGMLKLKSEADQAIHDASGG